MRVIVFLILLVLLMSLGGWLVFRSGEHSATVEFRTDRMQQDTSRLIQGTRELVEDAAREARQATSSDPAPADAEPGT